MNDTNMENRLTQLFSKVENCSKLNKKAMLDGITAGFRMINDYYDKIMSELFIDTMSINRLDATCHFFGIDTELSEQEKRQLVTNKLNENVRIYTSGELLEKLQSIDENVTIQRGHFRHIISTTTRLPIPKVAQLQAVLDAILPPINDVVQIDGNGYTFFEWDRNNFSFYELDAMNFSFDIANTMRRQ